MDINIGLSRINIESNCENVKILWNTKKSIQTWLFSFVFLEAKAILISFRVHNQNGG
jgi:hypothetical protein